MWLRVLVAVLLSVCAGCGSKRGTQQDATSPGNDESIEGELPEEFTDPNGCFRITFPNTRVEVPPPKEVVHRPDFPVRMAIWATVTADRHRYSVNSLHGPEDMIATIPDDRDTFQKSGEWREVSRDTVNLGGQSAVLVELTSRDGTKSSVCAFVRAKRVSLALTVIGERELSKNSKGVTAFFSSLVFTE